MQRQRAQSVSLDAERRKMLRQVGGGQTPSLPGHLFSLTLTYINPNPNLSSQPVSHNLIRPLVHTPSSLLLNMLVYTRMPPSSAETLTHSRQLTKRRL